MKRRHAVQAHGGGVLGRDVADVLLEAVVRVASGHPRACNGRGDLGDDRRGGDRGAGARRRRSRARCSRPHTGQPRSRRSGATSGSGVQRLQRLRQRRAGSTGAARGGRSRSAGHDDHRDGGAHPQIARRTARSRSGGGQLLGVVEAGHRSASTPLHVEADRGHHQRPGQAAAAGLVGAGHPPDAQLAVVGEQAGGRSGRHPATGYRPMGGLVVRACAGGRAASRWRTPRR